MCTILLLDHWYTTIQVGIAMNAGTSSVAIGPLTMHCKGVLILVDASIVCGQYMDLKDLILFPGFF
jgi:hypothetical protein